MHCSIVQKHHGSVESFYVSNALPLNALLVNFSQFKPNIKELFWVSLAWIEAQFKGKLKDFLTV